MLDGITAQVALWRLEREGEELLVYLLETMFSNKKTEAFSVPAEEVEFDL